MKRRKWNLTNLLIAAFFAVNIVVPALIENSTFVVSEFSVRSEKMENPIAIAQISDLHEKEFGADNAQLFDALAAIKPDLIVVTGDIIKNSYTASPNIPYMETLARGCAEIAPTFFITGNHDRHHPQTVKDAFAKNGVTVLNNCVVPFTIGQTTLQIAGIEDQSIDLQGIEKFDYPDDGNFRLLLAHKPEPLKEYAQKGTDLILSGHTHGGQVRLPFGKAVFTPEGFLPKISDGVYRQGDTTMIVSMGLGVSVIPFRLFAPGEITIIRLLQG